MQTLTVFGELLKPWIYAILSQDRDEINLDWTCWKDVFMSAISDLDQKDQGKKHPALDHQWKLPRSAEKGGCSLKAEEISYWPPTTEVSRTSCKAKTLIRESRDIYFSSRDSDLARQLKRFWSFFKLKNKTRTFPETMNSGDDNQQGPQASTPQQIAALFNSYFVLVFTAHSEVRTLSAPFTPSHPTLNELEIPVWHLWNSLI